MKNPITLAIDTASSNETVALLLWQRVLETRWRGNKDESEKLLLVIEKMLKKARVNFKDLNRIVVVNGPGPFSAVRIGVTVGNMLGAVLKIPVYTLSAADLWRARLGKNHKKAHMLLFAGGRFVGHQSGPDSYVEIADLENVLWALGKNKQKAALEFFGDLPDNMRAVFKRLAKPSWKWLRESSMESFGKVVAGAAANMLHKENPARPPYFKPPNITYGISHYVSKS